MSAPGGTVLMGDTVAAMRFIDSLPHKVVTLVSIDPDTGQVDGLSRPKKDPALHRFLCQTTSRTAPLAT